MNKISIFVDGSCINNGKKNSIGSIGIYCPDCTSLNISKNITDLNFKITNQTMELYACIEVFNILDKLNLNISCVYIYSDSTYVINSMTKWFKKWSENNWLTTTGKSVSNQELIKTLYTLKNKYFVIFKHVKSHQKKPDENDPLFNIWYGNYMADKFAYDANDLNKDNKINKDDIINENIEDINENIEDINENIEDINKKIKNMLNV